VKWHITSLSIALVAVSATAFADFRYEEKTAITGGSLVAAMKMAGTFSKQARQAGQPTTSSIFVKGNRMVRSQNDSAEIVDLDKETITRIDHTRKQYSVVTFQQLKQQMEDAARTAREKGAEQPPDRPEPANDTKMSFDVKVRNTGASKDVAGLSATESILTMALNAQDKKTGQTGAMAITNDMWMAPDIPGYQEVRDFQRRFATKMGSMMLSVAGPAATNMQPSMGTGMAELAKEMSKLKGVPVYQVMRFGSAANGQTIPAASEAPLPASNSPEMPTAGQVAGSAAESTAKSAAASKAGRMGGVISGLPSLGGFGRKKKKDEAPKDEQKADTSAQNAQPATSVMMETTVEMTNFGSAPIEATRFEVPAGYAKIEPGKHAQ
jgi:hypothetical protein